MSTAQRVRNQSKGQLVVEHLRVASNFITRGIGLLGTAQLPVGHGLLIHDCNSIHTFFMRYKIDAVFVDRQLRVQKVYHALPAWRITWPVFKAKSVLELPAGAAARAHVEVGDQLYVGD